MLHWRISYCNPWFAVGVGGDHAGIVEHNFNMAHLGPRRIRQRFHIGFRGHVAFESGGAAPQSLNLFDDSFCVFEIDVGYYQIRAGCRKGQGNAETDPLPPPVMTATLLAISTILISISQED